MLMGTETRLQCSGHLLSLVSVRCGGDHGDSRRGYIAGGGGSVVVVGTLLQCLVSDLVSGVLCLVSGVCCLLLADVACNGACLLSRYEPILIIHTGVKY